MFIVHVSSIVFPILCILCTLPCTYKHVYLTWILFIPVIGALLSHPCMLPSRMVRNQLQKCGCHTQNGNHLLKTLLHSCWWSKVQQGNHKNNQQINQQRQNSLSLEVNSYLQENMEKCNYLFLTAWISTGGKWKCLGVVKHGGAGSGNIFLMRLCPLEVCVMIMIVFYSERDT